MDYKETLARMQSGRLYLCDQEQLAKEQLDRLDLVFAYNQLRPSQQEEKRKLLKDMFLEFGQDSYLETPFYASWAGKRVSIGNCVYANFNLVLVDDCEIRIGDHVMIAPNVVLTTGTHPVSPELRLQIAQYNLPITIEDNVWIGANCVVMPGVRIGKNSVIGAGSVVTHHIPSDVVALGTPCRVLRTIDETDRQYYRKGFPIDLKQ